MSIDVNSSDTNNLLDQIHRSIIDLENNQPKSEIENIFKKSLLYLDENLDEQTVEELFLLISICFSKISDQPIEFFDELCLNCTKNSNRFIATVFILSQIKYSSYSQTIKKFILSVNKQILEQISKSNEKFEIFNLEIIPKFRGNFIIDCILLKKIAKKDISNLITYVFSQKNLSKTRICKFIQKILKHELLSFCPEFILTDVNVFPYFSQENLSLLIPKLTKDNFNKILKLIEETFSNKQKWKKQFAASLLEKFFEFDIDFNSINKEVSALILKSIKKSMLKPSIYNYFVKYNVILTNKIELEINEFPDPVTTLKIFSNVDVIPNEILAKGLLKTNDLNVFERLFNHDFHDKKISIFSDKNFWIHIFSIISTSESKYSTNLLNQLSKLFNKFVPKDDLYVFFESMIFENFPTTNNGNLFLCDLLDSFNPKYRYKFMLNRGVLIQKVFESKILPLPSFWHLFSYNFIISYFKDKSNESFMLYAYKFSYSTKRKKLDKITIKPLDNENLVYDFIMHNDINYLVNMDENSLLLILASIIFIDLNENIKIDGLSKETILPFYATSYNYLRTRENKFFISISKMNDLCLEACKSVSKSESNLFFESINSILSYFNLCIDSSSLPNEAGFQMLDILINQLLNNNFKADRFLLLRIFFNLSNIINDHVKFLFDKYGTNLFKYIIQNMSQIENFDKLKKIQMNLDAFDSNKITQISVDTIQNSLNYEVIINTICFLEDYSENTPQMKFAYSKNFIKMINKMIEKNKWKEILILSNFIKKNELDKDHTELSINNFLFDDICFEKLISEILNDQQIETKPFYFELIFKILMKDSATLTKYIAILLEKITDKQVLSPKLIMKKYSNEYNSYGNNFINAICHFYGYHSNSYIFIRKAKFENNKLSHLKFTLSFISKIINEGNKNPRSLQVFLLLMNIARSFPFLFENKADKIFNLILESLNSFSLLITLQNDSDKEQVKDLKVSLAAFFTLYHCLHSVQILEKFIPWIFGRITLINPSQILSFTYLLLFLFHTKKIKNVMLSLSSKYNFPEIAQKLLQIDVQQEKVRSQYKANIFSLLKKMYRMINKYCYKKKLVLIDEMKNVKNPFTLLFNNSITIYPQQIKMLKIPIPDIDEIKTFMQDINKIKSFWIDYDYQSIKEPTKKQVGNLIKHYKKLEKQIPDVKSIYPVDIPYFCEVRDIRYCARQFNWIYQWIIKNEKFPEFQEHNHILYMIINSIKIMHFNNNNNNSEKMDYDEIDNDYFFLNEFCQNDLFNIIIKEAASFEENDNDLFISLFCNLTENKVALISFFDLINRFVIENRDETEKVKRLIKIIFKSKIYYHSDFETNFIDVCGKKLIDLSLSPGYRNDWMFLYYLSDILCSVSNLPNCVTYLICFMINFNQKEVISNALHLYKNIKANEDDMNRIRKSIEKSFVKQFNNPTICFDSIYSFLLVMPSLIKSKISSIPNLLNKSISIYVKGDKNDQSLINLICIFFDALAPERKENQSVVPTDEIDFSLSCTAVNIRSSNNKSQTQIVRQAPQNLVDSNPKFWKLYGKHIKIIDEILINNERKLENLKFLLNFPELLSFEKRLSFFREKMKKKIIIDEKFDIHVSRSNILIDSFNQLNSKKDEKWFRKLNVSFNNEKGVDMGGLTKEWFTLIVREIFNPNFALFTLSENKSYQPNHLSGINQEHIEYFKFAGKVIARAILGEQYVNAHFTRSFCRQILRRQVKLKDFEDLDENIYNSLQMILNEDVEPLALNFTIDVDEYGVIKTVLLKEKGDEIDVTNENKIEYVSLYANYRLRRSIINQINAFCDGFNSIIPHEDIKFFSPSELDLIICGIPEIDVDDLKKNVSFSNPYSLNHPVIILFFNVISNWNPENLAKLLLFITGSSQVPVNGFADYKDSGKPITISYGGDNSRLCVAHTCFNTLDLPEYDNEIELNSKLLLSIQECEFGLA